MDQDKKDHKCGFCKRGKEVEPQCGKLWHDELQKCTAHKKCMQYSALLIQYKMRRFGGFKVNRVIKEIQRGKRLKCAICMKDRKLRKIAGGATAGCAVKKCKKTFHFYCAHKDKEAITKRIEMKKSDGPSVSYCVFCGDEHESEFLKSQNCSWVAKDTDSEEENNESCSESENEKSDDDDEDESRESSESGSKTSSRCDKGDVSKKDDDSGQQQPPSSSGKNGTANEKGGSENRDGTNSPTSDSTISDIFGDKVSSSKLCANTSGYNLSEAAQSLAQPEDGSTNPARGFLQEGADAHPGDVRKRSNVDDAETSAKKKKLDGSVNRGKLFPGADDTVFVVCFLEKRDLADAKTTAILQKCANKVFNVPPDAIFLWQYNGRPLSPGHIVYLLNEISKALCYRNEEELHRLMFNVQDKDISKFDSAVQHNDSLPNEIREELYSNIRQQISDNFDKAEQSCGQCVGKICLIKPLSTHVGFVLLCHNTDATGVARSQMHGEKPIYVWDRELVLVPYDCREISNRGSLRQREYDKLQRYLRDIPVSRVHSWPKDAVLRLADEYSVTGRLHARYSSNLTPAGAHLIFLGPVDRSIMHYGLYIPKRITMILDELLTGKHEVYCVLDVGPEVGLCSLTDIVPRLSPGIELEAFIANDPKMMHASCAVLHFSLSV